MQAGKSSPFLFFSTYSDVGNELFFPFKIKKKAYHAAESLIYKKMSVSPAFKTVISSSHICLRGFLKSG